MGYDRGDSFPFDFEPNGISFDSKSKGKLSSRSYPIQYERKWKYSFPIAYWKDNRNRPYSSERPASFGIMGDQLGAPRKPLGPSQPYHIEGLKGGRQMRPYYAERRQYFLQRIKCFPAWMHVLGKWLN